MGEYKILIGSYFLIGAQLIAAAFLLYYGYGFIVEVSEVGLKAVLQDVWCGKGGSGC